MTTRTNAVSVTFHRPFSLSGIDQLQPAGTYVVETDEELIEGLSFSAYRRVATTIRLPVQSSRAGFSQSVPINPVDLDGALAMDAQADRAG